MVQMLSPLCYRKSGGKSLFLTCSYPSAPSASASTKEQVRKGGLPPLLSTRSRSRAISSLNRPMTKPDHSRKCEPYRQRLPKLLLQHNNNRRSTSGDSPTKFTVTSSAKFASNENAVACRRQQWSSVKPRT